MENIQHSKLFKPGGVLAQETSAAITAFVDFGEALERTFSGVWSLDEGQGNRREVWDWDKMRKRSLLFIYGQIGLKVEGVLRSRTPIYRDEEEVRTDALKRKWEDMKPQFDAVWDQAATFLQSFWDRANANGWAASFINIEVGENVGDNNQAGEGVGVAENVGDNNHAGEGVGVAEEGERV